MSPAGTDPGEGVDGRTPRDGGLPPDAPDREAQPEERSDRAAATAELVLAVATGGGLLALLATAAYMLRLFGWFG